MECKKCKAILKEGETFCRKCATSIYVDDIEVVKPSSGIHKINKIKKAIDMKPTTPYVVPETIDLSTVNNKDLINRGQNDESIAKNDIKKSLTIIFLSLLLLAGLIAIAVSFL